MSKRDHLKGPHGLDGQWTVYTLGQMSQIANSRLLELRSSYSSTSFIISPTANRASLSTADVTVKPILSLSLAKENLQQKGTQSSEILSISLTIENPSSVATVTVYID
ncbi:hypothetical protein TNCT_52621 [Trichonephila clavata]|uniref:Uncharacterized protein n=1 Tax=Trichonephila clavata TaxID=2740835 RepID=A0A8X6LC73_TRICU|nr:hypothetical protein TNCT_52621 [Trichonephila clavata]